MGAVLSALTTGLVVIVLAIAAFSLFVVATIPVGRFLERRRDRADDAPHDADAAER